MAKGACCRLDGPEGIEDAHVGSDVWRPSRRLLRARTCHSLSWRSSVLPREVTIAAGHDRRHERPGFRCLAPGSEHGRSSLARSPPARVATRLLSPATPTIDSKKSILPHLTPPLASTTATTGLSQSTTMPNIKRSTTPRNSMQNRTGRFSRLTRRYRPSCHRRSIPLSSSSTSPSSNQALGVTILLTMEGSGHRCRSSQRRSLPCPHRTGRTTDRPSCDGHSSSGYYWLCFCFCYWQSSWFFFCWLFFCFFF